MASPQNITALLESGIGAFGVVAGSTVASAIGFLQWGLLGAGLLVLLAGGHCCFRGVVFLLGPVGYGLVLASTAASYLADPEVVRLSSDVMLILVAGVFALSTVLTYIFSLCCCGARDPVWTFGGPLGLLLFRAAAHTIPTAWAASQLAFATGVGVVFYAFVRCGRCKKRVGPALVAVVGGTSYAAYAALALYSDARSPVSTFFLTGSTGAEPCIDAPCVGLVVGSMVGGVAAGSLAHALWFRCQRKRAGGPASGVPPGYVPLALVTATAPPPTASAAPPPAAAPPYGSAAGPPRT